MLVLAERPLFEKSAYVDPQYRYDWIATPFYSYIFLSPVWLLGSQFAFGLMGWSVGSITLFGFYRILRNRLKKLPAKFEILLMALIALNFNFLVDSFAVSTMSVAAMFGVLAFVGPSRWLRIIMLCCVAMTRSNYIVALASAFLALLLFRPQGWKDLLIDFSPSVAATVLFYSLFYSITLQAPSCGGAKKRPLFRASRAGGGGHGKTDGHLDSVIFFLTQPARLQRRAPPGRSGSAE